jgi:hypothetical protein
VGANDKVSGGRGCECWQPFSSSARPCSGSTKNASFVGVLVGAAATTKVVCGGRHVAVREAVWEGEARTAVDVYPRRPQVSFFT